MTHHVLVVTSSRWLLARHGGTAAFEAARRAERAQDADDRF